MEEIREVRNSKKGIWRGYEGEEGEGLKEASGGCEGPNGGEELHLSPLMDS